MPKRKFKLKTSTAEKRPPFETQKRKKNEQDTSSAAPKKFGNITKNKIMLQALHEDYNAIQEDHEDYNATQEDHEDNNISSRVSLSDDESDNGSVSSQVFSPDYDNNKPILPHTVSSIHENNETTSPHPVTSSGHENDVSQEDDISLPIQRSGNIINFSNQIRTPYQESTYF
ncbi:hypothetical protein C2G38_2036717 [Gigaspora rosea]|uniref:Uncharacterized protein n=1 Tax=Gigaspora rosea TaxID=44941 RepID=A0A397V9R0_9GLOM|nr:hypothetical protein C2G38_2036717 [Gigaspora rosea]